MKIVNTRRISQAFFLTLLLWFCIVSSVGDKFWQMRNWPFNWFFQLDPLVALGTIASTHTLYKALLWALFTVILTIILGRFFCGWVCPFGSIHHFVSYLSHRRKKASQKITLNRYSKGQRIKYFILIILLAMAVFPSIASTLQIGLFDPISLVTRSVNLSLLPLADQSQNVIWTNPRLYFAAWIILSIFLSAILLNLVIPRFYCRFICPLGALLALLGRFSIWRIGKTSAQCSACGSCSKNCQTACQPDSQIHISECILCFNCREDCPQQTIAYQTGISKAGQVLAPDISRRGFVLSLSTAVLAVPAIRLSASTANKDSAILRPPGALPEEEFLKRCLKCSQCMRVCPTNVIQPAGFSQGIEYLWSPVMNNRIGSSGCQLNCVACAQICPTAAIRPISLDEKLGKGQYSEVGPIRIGTAFLDRGRCLPWATDKPCIVCQENCPLSPKAIYTKQVFVSVINTNLSINDVTVNTIEIQQQNLTPQIFATGDYYCLFDNGSRLRIIANTEQSIELSDKPAVQSGNIQLQVKLQQPFIDPERCIGCGICEHECPVKNKPAIRVSPTLHKPQ